MNGCKKRNHVHPQLVDKSVGLLTQAVHLTIVDLFPSGRRDPHGLHCAIWNELDDSGFEPLRDRPWTFAAYHTGPQVSACLESEAVDEPLPGIPLFLTTEGYVALPLEETCQATCNVCPELPRRAVLDAAEM